MKQQLPKNLPIAKVLSADKFTHTTLRRPRSFGGAHDATGMFCDRCDFSGTEVPCAPGAGCAVVDENCHLTRHGDGGSVDPWIRGAVCPAGRCRTMTSYSENPTCIVWCLWDIYLILRYMIYIYIFPARHLIFNFYRTEDIHGLWLAFGCLFMSQSSPDHGLLLGQMISDFHVASFDNISEWGYLPSGNLT